MNAVKPGASQEIEQQKSPRLMQWRRPSSLVRLGRHALSLSGAAVGGFNNRTIVESILWMFSADPHTLSRYQFVWNHGTGTVIHQFKQGPELAAVAEFWFCDKTGDSMEKCRLALGLRLFLVAIQGIP